ncbi:MAG: hypothetical protein BWK76_13515 [Desulfobulbaceae bacterium A2]|nr:MAG: hypothetical protein BWK76_13515 [Desulfobulbaceae bacterium A2]
MRLALFDLDHTLLDGDSNALWLSYLAGRDLLPPGTLERQDEEYARYEAGQLDIEAYLRFQLSLLTDRPLVDWFPLRGHFLATEIIPRIPASARAAIAAHRCVGDRMAILTATHSFLADGIGELLTPLPVIAPRAATRNGCLTGEISGEICFAERKFSCLCHWLAGEGLAPADFRAIHFYSDSSNDLPLLEQVSHPVAVNADARLAEIARQRGWPRQSWRCRSC